MTDHPAPSQCAACGAVGLSFIGELPIYVRNEDRHDTIWRCDACGTYQRAVDYTDIAAAGHFEVSSYTPLEVESQRLSDRGPFFDYLLTLGTNALKRPLADMRILDIGCAYGHLLDRAGAKGAVTAGVELVDTLRDRLPSRGHAAYRTVAEIPESEQYDLILSIDSLYYFEDPASVLQQARPHLAKGGLLMLRVPNRTPVLQLMRKLRTPITNGLFGDAKCNFSYAGMRQLLSRAGYEIVWVQMREKGKGARSAAVWLYYRLSYAASVILRRKLTPGIIILALPRPD